MVINSNENKKTVFAVFFYFICKSQKIFYMITTEYNGNCIRGLRKALQKSSARFALLSIRRVDSVGKKITVSNFALTCIKRQCIFYINRYLPKDIDMMFYTCVLSQ